VSALREHAPLGVRLRTTFVRRVVLLACGLDDETERFPVPAGLRVAVLTPDEMDAYGRLRPDQDAPALALRLARGDRCFAVLDDGGVMHATWASAAGGPLPYLDADAELATGDVCLYDSYTSPTRRGLDLSRCRDEFCRRHYRALGMRRTIALIARENAAGLRTAEPLGYRAIGEYGLLRLGPLRRRWTVAYGAEPLLPLRPRRRAAR